MAVIKPTASSMRPVDVVEQPAVDRDHACRRRRSRRSMSSKKMTPTAAFTVARVNSSSGDRRVTATSKAPASAVNTSASASARQEEHERARGRLGQVEARARHADREAEDHPAEAGQAEDAAAELDVLDPAADGPDDHPLRLAAGEAVVDHHQQERIEDARVRGQDAREDGLQQQRRQERQRDPQHLHLTPSGVAISGGGVAHDQDFLQAVEVGRCGDPHVLEQTAAAQYRADPAHHQAGREHPVEAGGHDDVPLHHVRQHRHELHDQVARGRVRGARLFAHLAGDDASHAAALDPRAEPALLVEQQLHLRRPGSHADHASDDAGGADDGGVQGDPLARSLVDRQAAEPGQGLTHDHLRHQRVVGQHLAELQQLAQARGLLGVALALLHPGLHLAQAILQPAVLGADAAQVDVGEPESLDPAHARRRRRPGAATRSRRPPGRGATSRPRRPPAG